jgi:hypothetical protein
MTCLHVLEIVALIQLGIPVSDGQRLTVNSEEKFMLYSTGAELRVDGVDPLQVEEFLGQDHYDCARFANGGFGAVQEQLDCV